MPRLTWLADAARATGFPVTEVPDWQTRGSATFNPRGLVWHHTAGPASGDLPSFNILVNGRKDLPGPLCNYGLGRSGTIYVIAAGRANHAGAGSWNGLTGNASVMGIEAEHTGRIGDPWPAQQLAAYRALSAEILTRLDTTVAFLCGHKEWAPVRKVDPIGLNMTQERGRVKALMEIPQQGDNMAVSEWAKNAWDWATGLGIFTTASKPQAPITVEQFGVFLKRYDNHVQKQIAENSGTSVSTDAVISEIVDRLS